MKDENRYAANAIVVAAKRIVELATHDQGSGWRVPEVALSEMREALGNRSSKVTPDEECWVRMSHYGTCARGTKGCSRRDPAHAPAPTSEVTVGPPLEPNFAPGTFSEPEPRTSDAKLGVSIGAPLEPKFAPGSFSEPDSASNEATNMGEAYEYARAHRSESNLARAFLAMAATNGYRWRDGQLVDIITPRTNDVPTGSLTYGYDMAERLVDQASGPRALRDEIARLYEVERAYNGIVAVRKQPELRVAKFVINNVAFSTEVCADAIFSWAQLRRLAHIPEHHAGFIEHRDGDIPLPDSYAFDLSVAEPPQIYTCPPATFGGATRTQEAPHELDPEHCAACREFVERNAPPKPPVEVKNELWQAAILKVRQLEAEIRKSGASEREKSNMLHTHSKLWMFAADAWEQEVIRPAQRRVNRPDNPPCTPATHYFNGDVCWKCGLNYGEPVPPSLRPPTHHDSCSRGALYCVLDHENDDSDCHDEDGKPAQCIACSKGVVVRVYHENGARCPKTTPRLDYPPSGSEER